MGFGIITTWVQIRAQLPMNCVTLSKLLNHPEPQFPHL